MSNNVRNGGMDSDMDLFAIEPPSVPLSPFFNVTLNGDCAARGVGMRNRGFGTIDMTGSVPPGSVIVRAFLYWAVIRGAADPVSSPDGTLNEVDITGTLIATAGTPCWPFQSSGALVDVFRADVTGIATDGSNDLTNFPSGLTNGAPPQSAPEAFPLLEGASLVLVFANPSLSLKTVVINDGGVTFANDTVSTTLSGFRASNSPQAKTFYIVADGQAVLPDDQALFNGMAVAGPTTSLRPLDAFNGQDGIDAGIEPGNGLWDTLEVDVSSLVNEGDTSATASVTAQIDCLTYIAQVLCVTGTATCPVANPQTCCQVAVEFKTQLVPPALASADVMTEVFFTQAPVVEDVCPEKVIVCGTVAKRITYTAVDEQGKQCRKEICDERAFQCIIDREDANEGDSFEVCGFAVLCEGTPRLQNRGTRPGFPPGSKPVDVFWKVLEKNIVKVCVRRLSCNDCKPLPPPCE